MPPKPLSVKCHHIKPGDVNHFPPFFMIDRITNPCKIPGYD